MRFRTTGWFVVFVVTLFVHDGGTISRAELARCNGLVVWCKDTRVEQFVWIARSSRTFSRSSISKQPDYEALPLRRHHFKVLYNRPPPAGAFLS